MSGDGYGKWREKRGVGRRLVSVRVVSNRCDGDWGGDERGLPGGDSQATKSPDLREMNEQEERSEECGDFIFSGVPENEKTRYPRTKKTPELPFCIHNFTSDQRGTQETSDEQALSFIFFMIFLSWS